MTISEAVRLFPNKMKLRVEMTSSKGPSNLVVLIHAVESALRKKQTEIKVSAMHCGDQRQNPSLTWPLFLWSGEWETVTRVIAFLINIAGKTPVKETPAESSLGVDRALKADKPVFRYWFFLSDSDLEQVIYFL